MKSIKKNSFWSYLRIFLLSVLAGAFAWLLSLQVLLKIFPDNYCGNCNGPVGIACSCVPNQQPYIYARVIGVIFLILALVIQYRKRK